MKQSAWFKLFAVLVSVLMLWNSAFATIFAFQQDSWNSMAGLQKQPNPGRQFSKSPKKPKRSLPRSSYDRDTRGGLWSDASSSAYKTAKIVKESNRGLWTIDSIFCAAQVPTSGEAFPWEGSYGDVNTNTGNKQTSLDIVDWPSRGSLNVAVTLYHSSDAGPDVRPYMQTGWSHSYDIQLEKIIDGGSEYAYVYWGDGTTYPYGALDGNTHEYALPTGIFDRLTTTGTGANQVWTLTTKSQWKYEFNNGGRCTAIKDRWGHQITITWAADALGHYRVTTVADPDARTVTFGYNSSTKLLESITDPASRVFTLTSTSGNLTKVEWPLLSGQSQRSSHQYTYSSGAIASETSRRGKTTSYTYSADGLASETTPAGLVTSYAYETPRDPNYPNDSVGTQITLPKPSGTSARILTHMYDSGLLIQELDELGNAADHSYTANNLEDNYNDRRGSFHTKSYDSMGNVVETYDGSTDVHSVYTYNSTNDVTSVINGEGIKTVMEYFGANDSNGPEGALKLVKTRLTTGPETFLTRKSFTYYTSSGDKGELKTIKDGLNRTTTLAYTTRGELESITKPDGTVTYFTSYGTLSNLLTLVDSANITTTLGYDNWYRRSTAAQGNSTVTTAFLDDDLVSTRTLSGSDLPQSNANQVTSYAYDNDGRLTTKTNAKNESETYSYTFNSAVSPYLHSITNGRGYTRTYEYGVNGLVVFFENADSKSEEWSYDEENNVTAYSCYADGINDLVKTITYAYDELNRLTLVDYTTGTDTTFSYDTIGRMTSMVDSTGTTSWEYFKTNLVKKMTAPNGNVEYTYNDADQLLTTVTGEGTTTNSYDSYGRPSTVQNPANETTTWTYDSSGRVNKQTLSTGAYEDYGYDTRGRMTSVTVKNSSNSTIESQSMTYDDANNMKNRTHNGVQTDYTYDKINQILSEQKGTSGQSSYFRDEYTYDANGNRTQKVEKRGATPAVTTRSYTYNSSDRMTNYDGTTITYNGVGNPESWVVDKPNGGGRGVVNLTYDYEDRVVGMRVPGQGSDYQANSYNGLGTRVKVVDNGYGSGTRKYVRGGAGVTDPVLRMTTGAENSPTWTNYTPGVSERTSGTSKFMHAGIKNADAQSNSSQAISATREYDAFGNVTSSTGTHTGRFGYGGPHGYQEDEGGLKQLGHRLYDPVAGRFVTKDPIKDGRNWYAYCDNNPLTYSDRTGAGACAVIGGLVGSVVGGIVGSAGGGPVGGLVVGVTLSSALSSLGQYLDAKLAGRSDSEASRQAAEVGREELDPRTWGPDDLVGRPVEHLVPGSDLPTRFAREGWKKWFISTAKKRGGDLD